MKKAFLSISILLVISAAILSLSFSTAEATANAKQYELKYKLAKGTKFIITSSGTTESTTDQMGTEMVADITGTSVNTYVVLVADKGLTIELEYGERTQEVESYQGSASTDFSELIGKKVKFILMPNGEVTDLKGFDMLPEITTSAGETMNADIYELTIKRSFSRLPDKPVAIGDTWTHTETNEIPLGGGVITSDNTTTYKVIEVTKKDGFDCLKIKVTGTEQIQGSLEQGGTPLFIERETSSTGTLYFAYKEGMFVYNEAESKGEGLITLEQAGIELPQTVLSKGTVSVQIVH